MAAGSSPMADMLRRAIMSRLGQGGAPGGGGPSPMAGANPDAIGQAVSGQYAELQGADPGKMSADLQRIKAELAAMFPNAVLRVGDAGKGISQAIVGINASIKAFDKAQETLKNVHPPLGIAAANPQPLAEGGSPAGPPMSGGGSGMGGF